MQLDNARGSNKNTYLWGYLANLVERWVFREIYVSFLPVGHTHFGPDRVASRISVGVRYRNVLSLEQFVDLIRRSHTPAPSVEHISEVADWRLLMNPSSDPQYTGARIKVQAGICTLRPCSVPSMVQFVSDTSSLHWYFTTDLQGNATIQDRQIDAVKAWSPVTYPFGKEFTERDGAATKEKRSGITSLTLPLLLKQAPSRPITAERTAELRQYIHDMSPRLEQPTIEELYKWVDCLSTLREDASLGWVDDGLFKSEMDPEVDDTGLFGDEDDFDESIEGLAAKFHDQSNRLQLSFDRSAIQDSAARLNQVRGQSLANYVHVTDFISYKPFYNNSVSQQHRKQFYVAHVLALHPNGAEDNGGEPCVQVQCYQTSNKPAKLLDSTVSVIYKPYKRSSSCIQDVLLKDIFTVFRVEGSKESKFTLKAQWKRDIARELTTRAANPSTRTGIQCAPG